MTETVTVQLSYGAVRGRSLGDHLSFRGIPYAAPPVGELRWSSPAAPKPWTGAFDATEPGNPAPQPAQFPGDVTRVDEDCLNLEVTVPVAPGTTARPVLVWLHGGGGTNGSGAEFDARRLAVSGDIIVVKPNYRLGVLGCFGHPGLAGSGTFGLQDQQSALRWVRDEIGRFGGDPQNVTLAGMSYGALTVAGHLVSPSSVGLFHRAILQSGFGVIGSTPAHTFIPGVPELPQRWIPVAELDELGAATALEHGWVRPGGDPASALEQLRQVPVADLLPASGAFIRPAFGGTVLPESPGTALAADRFHRMPMMLGTARDEARFFVSLFADLAGNPVTADGYRHMLSEAFGADADRIATRYPLDHFPTPSLAWAQISTDRAWAQPVWELGRAFAAATATWFYEFNDPEAPPTVPGFPAGSVHGAELRYQFDVEGGVPLSASQRDLAESMNRYWAAFVRNGDPAQEDLPAWPDFGTGHVQSLSPQEIKGVDYAGDHRLDLWTEVG